MKVKDEELMKQCIELAKKGIDLEELFENMKPLFEIAYGIMALALKNYNFINDRRQMMKLELKENMYIRTKDGIIAKVDYIDDNTIFFDKGLYRTYFDSIDFLEKDNLERIVKASFSIIDLIEEEDFVNEEMIVKIKEDKDGKYLVTMNNNVIRNQGIESILTKEQMEQMAYKVG